MFYSGTDIVKVELSLLCQPWPSARKGEQANNCFLQYHYLNDYPFPSLLINLKRVMCPET